VKRKGRGGRRKSALARRRTASLYERANEGVSLPSALQVRTGTATACEECGGEVA
jgi:hypothetical protein